MSVFAAAMVACCAATLASLLDILDGGEDFALLHVVAFIDIEVGDAAHGVGADVDVGFGRDLAGGADDGTRFSRVTVPIRTLV